MDAGATSQRGRLGRFALKATGVLLLPFALVSACYIFVPRVIAAYPLTFFATTVLAGLACSLPVRFSVLEIAWRAVYAVAMFALVIWAAYFLIGIFPQNFRLAFPHAAL